MDSLGLSYTTKISPVKLHLKKDALPQRITLVCTTELTSGMVECSWPRLKPSVLCEQLCMLKAAMCAAEQASKWLLLQCLKLTAVILVDAEMLVVAAASWSVVSTVKLS